MSGLIGEPVLIGDRRGAGGARETRILAGSPPDGWTFALAAAPDQIPRPMSAPTGPTGPKCLDCRAQGALFHMLETGVGIAP
jgi:hypothetical protein